MNSDAQIMMTTDRPGFFFPYWIMTSSCFLYTSVQTVKYRPVLDMLIIQQTDLFLQCFTYMSMSRYLLDNSRPGIIYLQQNVAPFLQLVMKRCVSFPLLFKKIPSMGLFLLKFRIKGFLTSIDKCNLLVKFWIPWFFLLLQINLELFDCYIYK